MPQTEFDTQSWEDESVRTVVPFTAFGSALTYSLPIQPRFVKNVRVVVSKAFDVSTSVKVGDAASDSGFLTSGMLDPKTLGRVENSFQNGAEDGTSGVTTFVGYEEGKDYSAAGGVLVITRQATTDTVGELTVTITYDGYSKVQRGFVDHQNPTYGKGDMDTVAWSGAADYTKPPAIP